MTTQPSASVAICVPTLNAGSHWCEWLDRVKTLLADVTLLVVDSSSTDDTVKQATAAGAQVRVIDRATFNHGATRNQALHWLEQDVVVFMTQDALLESAESLGSLIRAFDDPNVGAAYGRQLPHHNATPIAAHARLFNYPEHAYVVNRDDIPERGIKTAFLSNSFAAYRRKALIEAGGFPPDIILSEDMMAGARLLQQGWSIAYQADARVYHSHNYTLAQEFKRYFDIGVFHHKEHWLLEWLGKAEGEGKRFVLSELHYLLHKAPWRLPEAILRTALKYAGYRLGKLEHTLPLRLKRALSMHKRYWD